MKQNKQNRSRGGFFKIIKKDKHTQARLGVLSTPHGKIETPSYVIVATRAEIKCLKPSDIKKTKTQVVIANTYHLWNEALNSKLETLNKSKTQNSKTKTFLLKKLGTKLPTMTDSGGFQVFSLGFGKENKIGKILNAHPVDNRLAKSIIHRRKNIRISQRGVHFLLDGKKRFLGPKLSMQIQKKLGADIVFAFDECTSPLDSFDYNKKALERTHKWAQESLKYKVKSEKLSGKRQFLFGIVQGGRYKSLRIKSSKYIASLPFDGIGIGGSFGKDEMVKTIKCVIPTREARHGRIYTKNGHFDISKFRNISIPLEKECKCPVCKAGITRRKLYELFKGSDKEKQKAQRHATIHNIWFFNNLLEEIRKSIKNNKFEQFKNKFLKQFR